MLDAAAAAAGDGVGDIGAAVEVTGVSTTFIAVVSLHSSVSTEALNRLLLSTLSFVGCNGAHNLGYTVLEVVRSRSARWSTWYGRGGRSRGPRRNRRGGSSGSIWPGTKLDRRSDDAAALMKPIIDALGKE